MPNPIESFPYSSEVIAQIATDIEAYLDGGGSDKEAEHVRLGERHQLSRDAISEQWNDARLKRAKSVREQTGIKPALALLREGPDLSRTSTTQSVIQRQEGPERVGEFIRISLEAPYELARSFLLHRYSWNNFPTLRWWNGEWRRWDGSRYAEIEGDRVRAEIYDYIANANNGSLNPKQRHVNEVVDAIKGHVTLSGAVEQGTWLDSCPPPWGNDESIICCKNGVLRLSDRTLFSHDPRLFALNGIETDYVPGADATRWQQFLNELWSDDPEAREALQEFFGLVLTDETRFQKGFILVGPARSGKGTIARVLMALLGRVNYSGPSLGDLAQPFGMQGLIGRKLAVVPDARLDNRANRSVITEKLLSIIGEDPQEINRKNRPFWSGILRLRIMILSNELPDFKDETGVIATRFIILQTCNSFLGKEDTQLEDKLKRELSGILNWALEGLSQLSKRGCFKAPFQSHGLNDELSTNASSIKAFVSDCCELGPDFNVPVAKIHSSYLEYVTAHGGGWAERMPINQFSGRLRSAFHGQITTFRPRAENEGRKRVFSGIRLRKTVLK